jgi:hypothetical protein
VYLFLGEADDALARSLRAALEKRGAQVRALADPFSKSTRFSLRVDSTNTTSRLALEDGTCLVDCDIAGVFLRRRRAAGIAGPSSDDHGYIEAEIEAATLAWIWSLRCPVVNRLPAWLWYNPMPPLQFWSRLLQTSGLPEIDLDTSETASTGRKCAGPLGAKDRPMVYGRACVIGHLAVWNRVRPDNLGRYETALIEFTRCAGLSFLEVALVETNDGIRVKEVDPFPDLSRFCASSSRAITEALAMLFNDSNPTVPSK